MQQINTHTYFREYKRSDGTTGVYEQRVKTLVQNERVGAPVRNKLNEEDKLDICFAWVGGETKTSLRARYHTSIKRINEVLAGARNCESTVSSRRRNSIFFVCAESRATACQAQKIRVSLVR